MTYAELLAKADELTYIVNESKTLNHGLTGNEQVLLEFKGGIIREVDKVFYDAERQAIIIKAATYDR